LQWELTTDAYQLRYPTHVRIPILLGVEVLKDETDDKGVRYQNSSQQGFLLTIYIYIKNLSKNKKKQNIAIKTGVSSGTRGLIWTAPDGSKRS
jgi:hypothetical protein